MPLAMYKNGGSIVYAAKLYIPFEMYPEIQKVFVKDLIGVPLLFSSLDEDNHVCATMIVGSTIEAQISSSGVMASFALDKIAETSGPDFSSCRIVLDMGQNTGDIGVSLNKIIAFSGEENERI